MSSPPLIIIQNNKMGVICAFSIHEIVVTSPLSLYHHKLSFESSNFISNNNNDIAY
jgi:hypothetical protein